VCIKLYRQFSFPPEVIDVDDDDVSVSEDSNVGSSTDVIVDDIGDSAHTGFQGKCYVMTINNPNNNKVIKALSGHGAFGTALDKIVGIKYAVWSLEKGESGTPHYQCYFQLSAKKKYQALKNKLKTLGAWVAPAKGSAVESKDYISHTGKHADKAGLIAGPWSFGVVQQSGTRSDLEGLCNDIKAGKSLKQLAVTHTSSVLKYFGNTQKLINLIKDDIVRKWITELYIYTGVPGSGKSHSAHLEANDYLLSKGNYLYIYIA